MGRLLRRTLGEKVSVTYADAADPLAIEPYEALLAQVPLARRLYPMVFVNERFVLVGSADFHDVAYHVQHALQEQPA